MNVLIVDDSTAMRLMILRTLRQAGFDDHHFIQAPDGAAALELIQRQPPDLILCDWNMPNMSGMDLLTTLQDNGIKIQFGFITTEATAKMRHKALDAGAAFLITKPFTVDAFEQALSPIFK